MFFYSVVSGYLYNSIGIQLYNSNDYMTTTTITTLTDREKEIADQLEKQYDFIPKHAALRMIMHEYNAFYSGREVLNAYASIEKFNN